MVAGHVICGICCCRRKINLSPKLQTQVFLYRLFSRINWSLLHINKPALCLSVWCHRCDNKEPVDSITLDAVLEFYVFSGQGKVFEKLLE